MPIYAYLCVITHFLKYAMVPQAVQATSLVPYPQLQGYSNLLGICKDFSVSYLLDTTLDNNRFKHLGCCIECPCQDSNWDINILSRMRCLMRHSDLFLVL